MKKGDSDSAEIEAGREAWQRIQSAGRRSFDDWVMVARALAHGRAEAMQAAKANRPFGSKYNAAMGAWLRGNGLDGVNDQERSTAIMVLENLPAIAVWRATLSEDQRRSLNHPNGVWRHWRRSISAETAKRQDVVPRRAAEATGKIYQSPKPAAQRQDVGQHVNADRFGKLPKPHDQTEIVENPAPTPVTARHSSKYKGVFWTQDHMRRAHRAMLLSRSSDLLTLARVALQAAIRNEADLLALLPADPPAKKPRQIAAPAARTPVTKGAGS